MADPLVLKGKLDLTALPELYQELTARANQDLTLDMGQVTQIGALCVQTILAAARDMAKANMKVEIINTPEPVLVQLATLGFSPKTLSEGLL